MGFLVIEYTEMSEIKYGDEKPVGILHWCDNEDEIPAILKQIKQVNENIQTTEDLDSLVDIIGYGENLGLSQYTESLF